MANILVIDDDQSTRKLLRHVLEEARYTVFEAADGDQALRLARQMPFNLIITDILMPERDGLEVIRQMKRENPLVKIIALTGGGTYLGLETLQTAKDFGAIEAMAKPFDIHQLIDVVGKSIC
ncbi:MAG TPA: response regulator [Nitrospiraceae bacterium]|nr:response regulator [Nitrospiraceae bacterium]